MSISSTSKPLAADFTSTFQELNNEANQSASISSDDGRFQELQCDIDKMSADAPDDATKAKLASMKDDLNNLQTLADAEPSSTNTTNSSWQQLTQHLDDLAADAFGTADPLGINNVPQGNKSLNGVQAGGVGTAYKYLSVDDAKAAGLPEAAAQAQQTQQVNKVDTNDGPVYITSSNTSPITYDIYDQNNNKLNDQPLSNFALGLNDDKSWLKINEGGIAKAVPISGDQLSTLPQGTQLLDLNGAAANGNKLVSRGTVGTSGASATAAPADSAQSAQKLAALDLTSEAGQEKLKALYGNGSTPFANYLRKQNLDNQLNSLPDSGSIAWDKLAANMAKKGVTLYADGKGANLMYDSNTRTGGGFDDQGGSIATPGQLYDGKKAMSQTEPYTFPLGSSTVTFGKNDQGEVQKDSNGKVYGIQIS